MAICSAKTVAESFALLVAVYYIFNLVMCKHLMKTLVFMLKYACKIDDPVRDSYILRAYKQCLILVEKLTLKHQSKNRAGGAVGKKRSSESEAVSVTKGKGQRFPHGKESENEAVSVTKGKGQMFPHGKTVRTTIRRMKVRRTIRRDMKGVKEKCVDPLQRKDIVARLREVTNLVMVTIIFTSTDFYHLPSKE